MESHASTDRSVLSAMSGGVDSSVATALLLDEGFSVTGITMDLFDGKAVDVTSDTPALCGSSSDIADAQTVCEALGIPHITVDFRQEFATDVMDYFCDSYLTGTTPNPCIQCNRRLKLSGLQETRRRRGADYVATGHYVRRCRNPESGAWELLRARDLSKDQSYVLYHLTQDDLKHMLFPLGDLTKPEVRAVAKARGFTNARKRESQDICFVPDGDHVEFIQHYDLPDQTQPPFAPGDIVDRDGRVLGQHRGLIHYTTGQRKGIGLASPKPLYVWEKDVANNRLIVAHHDELLVQEIRVEDVNLIGGEGTAMPSRIQVKTNYNQQPVDAEVALDGKDASEDHRCAAIYFLEPQVRPASGQSTVFYSGDLVLGGGIIR